MGYSHDEVARRWSNGKKGIGANVFSDGTTIYSYGHHFPIAHRLKNGTVLFNTDKYSTSTSKHQNIVSSWAGEVIECNTKEIKSAINNYTEDPIIIEREKEVQGLWEGLDAIKKYCARKGVDYFPYKKYEKEFQDLINEWKEWNEEKKVGKIVWEKKLNDKTYEKELKVHWARDKRKLLFISFGKRNDYSEKEVGDILTNKKVIETTVPEEIIKDIKQKAMARRI